MYFIHHVSFSLLSTDWSWMKIRIRCPTPSLRLFPCLLSSFMLKDRLKVHCSLMVIKESGCFVQVLFMSTRITISTICPKTEISYLFLHSQSLFLSVIPSLLDRRTLGKCLGQKEEKKWLSIRPSLSLFYVLPSWITKTKDECPPCLRICLFCHSLDWFLPLVMMASFLWDLRSVFESLISWVSFFLFKKTWVTVANSIQCISRWEIPSCSDSSIFLRHANLMLLPFPVLFTICLLCFSWY